MFRHMEHEGVLDLFNCKWLGLPSETHSASFDPQLSAFKSGGLGLLDLRSSHLPRTACEIQLSNIEISLRDQPPLR